MSYKQRITHLKLSTLQNRNLTKSTESVPEGDLGQEDGERKLTFIQGFGEEVLVFFVKDGPPHIVPEARMVVVKVEDDVFDLRFPLRCRLPG